MRDLVQGISAYSKKIDPDFLIIPQNGHDILSMDTDAAAPPAMEYINAIDGVGQEDLFYGYTDDDSATSSSDSEGLMALLDLAEENSVQAIVTDYCFTESKMDDSYEKNSNKGYISFAADHRDLNNIPVHPQEAYNVNADDIVSLAEAKNFLYLLDPSGFDEKADYLEALKATDYDVLIIDAFFDPEMLSKEEVSSLKVKNNGGGRLVISYMSIGEAENYRYYWQDDWKVGSPDFLDKENKEWEGNYKTRYWEPEWQKIIYGQGTSYLDRLLDIGFDGVYLDIIEAFEYFENQ